MNPLATPERIAQAVGIATSAFLSGTFFSASALAAPGLLVLPTPQLLKGWAKVYDTGVQMGPPLSIFALVNHLFVAYKLYTIGSSKWTFAAAAGGLTMAVVPYTIIFMAPTNLTLHTAADKLQAGKTDIGMKDKEAKDLLSRWQKLNLMRAVPTMAGAVMALWVALW